VTGALFMVWGENEKVRAALPRAVASFAYVHPELPYEVIEMPADSDLRCKARMFELSPYDTTLYLDADTVVLGRMDHALHKAEQHGLAICINPHPWAKRYDALHAHGEITEYDTGVIAFTKNGAKRVFEAWKAGRDLNSRSYFLSSTGPCQMPVNDQCAFAHAIETTGFNPYVLPVNFNLHPRWQKCVFGPVKVWHDYGNVPDAIREWNAQQSAQGAIIQCGGIP
jgi:hypothetical protein